MTRWLAAIGRAIAENTVLRVLPGKTERRLAGVILLTAVLPLVSALYVATSMFRQAATLWYSPEIGEQLDRGVEVYKDYVRVIKDDLKHQTVAIAANASLREAARTRNVELVEAELDSSFAAFPGLVSLEVDGADGVTLGRRDRGRPVAEATERSLSVTRPLGDGSDPPVLVATFAVPRQRLDELEAAGHVVGRFHQIEGARPQLYEGYLNAFTAILVVTVLATIGVGILLARGVTKRIHRLGAALDLVAEGDLSVRVPVTGSDELTDLARSFNHMIAEIAQARARVEYLQRIGAWQEMAQRLAHEIKNPLTPIQLAVEECHGRYDGDDERFRSLLGTTREIVTEEIGTLRRLVTNFSSFARLPHAELTREDLSEFLAECGAQLGHLEDPSLGDESADAEPLEAPNVDIEWTLPKTTLPADIDRQMLRRVVVNLVRNAVQAIRDARRGAPEGTGPLGHVVVSARSVARGTEISIEDDGPGIAAPLVGRVFEPYFTTKVDGTGLGLAIVKKIVVEHGGTITADQSPSLGGARFTVTLPDPTRPRNDELVRLTRERARKQGVKTDAP